MTSLSFLIIGEMTNVKEQHSITSFQEDWLTDSRYKLCVRRIKYKPQKAYCILCEKSFDISTGGGTAVSSHGGGKGHTEKLKVRMQNQIGRFFQQSSSSSSSTTDLDVVEVVEVNDASSSTQSQSKLPYDISNDATDAEIIWCLNMVETHQSYRSCDGMPKVFRRMFKTSPVAQKFQMQKDKSRYTMIYGIAPVFRTNLIKMISSSPWFGVSFDESFNRQQQRCQMDVNIRHWNNNKNIAESAYLTSRMLLRPNADNLKDEIFASIDQLDKNKFLHLAMDGPSTNWLVLDLVDEFLSDGGFIRTINIGSCSLHILHGAFGTGILYTEWKLGKLMKAMFKILDESPMRRDIYLREGTSGKFPSTFSDTRWIEDEPVADRALEVWSSIVALVKHFQGLCQSKRPRNNKSYDTLVENYIDLLVPSKLHFFRFMAQIMQPYLIMFQTDAPMLPFMFDELANILYRLLRLVYRKKKLDEKSKLRDVMNEKFLKDEKNLIDVLQIDIGAAARDALNKVDVAAEKKRQFRKECRGAVVCVLLKLMERLPTNKMVVIQASALSPHNMIKIPDKAAKRFKGLADSLYSLKRISSSVADNAKDQFNKLLETEVKSEREKFQAFDFRKMRLDEFLYSMIGTKPEYADLWKICQLIFILNHGQAYTERGFSVNKQVSDDNMEDDSLIAQRLIYDTIKKFGDISQFPISKELRRSCKSAYKKMALDNEKKRKEHEQSDKDLKRKAKHDEIDNLKRRKVDVEKAISTLKTSLTKAAIASGTCGNKVREKAVEAAAFAKEMVEKEATLKELEEFEKKLEEEYKAIVM